MSYTLAEGFMLGLMRVNSPVRDSTGVTLVLLRWFFLSTSAVAASALSLDERSRAPPSAKTSPVTRPPAQRSARLRPGSRQPFRRQAGASWRHGSEAPGAPWRWTGQPRRYPTRSASEEYGCRRNEDVIFRSAREPAKKFTQSKKKKNIKKIINNYFKCKLKSITIKFNRASMKENEIHKMFTSAQQFSSCYYS